jgi:hypothetical protein
MRSGKNDFDVAGVVFEYSRLTVIPGEVLQTFRNIKEINVEFTELQFLRPLNDCGKLEILKASHNIGILRKLSFSLPIHILKLIYYSFIHCHITYCITAYGSAVKTNLHKLQILQNRALKIIHKLPLFTNFMELYSRGLKVFLRNHKTS